MKKDKLIRIRWLRRGSYLQVGERAVACGEECEISEELAAWLAEHYPSGYERVPSRADTVAWLETAGERRE